MILEGNQRAGAKNLAQHLLNDENDHVTVFELKGFISDDLVSALNEAHAISRGSKAKKHLFSLSLNPPQTENVSTSDFIGAIERAEETLELTGQPRAIVFHEKNARRHCHVVWSRIDANTMKAIPLPFTKLKLMEVSRELYLKHGWQMPKGFMRKSERDPNNFSLAQWQQAKRTGKDPKTIKETLRDCWAVSKTQTEFAQSLKERGYILAKGSRRAFVAIDQQCEVFSVPKWIGIRIKDVREKLADHETLSSVDKTKAQIAKDMTTKLSALQGTREAAIKSRLSSIQEERGLLKAKQIQERTTLLKSHEKRKQAETVVRQSRYNKGLKGLVDFFTGKRHKIAKQNLKETHISGKRDQKEVDKQIFSHLDDTRYLTGRISRLEEFNKAKSQTLNDDIFQYQEISKGHRERFKYDSQPIHKDHGLER